LRGGRKYTTAFFLFGWPNEGDGSIIVPETVRNENGKLLYPRIQITFVDKDAPLANQLMEVFASGTLEWSQNKTYLNLLIQDKKSLYLVANLINGNMRTPKILPNQTFKRLVVGKHYIDLLTG